MLLPGIDTYFLEVYHSNSFQHGGIGNKDIESILKREGFQPIRLSEGLFPFSYFTRYIEMKRWVKRIRPGSIVACQVPLYPRMYQWLIRKLSTKNVQLLFIVADFDGLRSNDSALFKKERAFLKLASHLILHSNRMEQLVKEFLPTARTSILGPFDFLTEPVKTTRILTKDLCFAGNLEKSRFLTYLKSIPELNFHIYGTGLAPSSFSSSRVFYHGSFSPYILPALIKGSFGLIWDGISPAQPDDSYAHYQRYNYPHKLSLYLMAGMPVIAPSYAAIAEYIKENEIGWVIDNLYELPKLILSIDTITYQKVAANCLILQQTIGMGQQLPNAIVKVFRT